MASFGIGMPVDLYVVGWVEEGAVDRGVLSYHLTQEVDIAAIAACDAVLAQLPYVARLDTGPTWHLGYDFVIGIIAIGQNDIDLACGEASERQIDIEIGQRKIRKFEFEYLRIPARIERDLVVGEAERFLLRLGQAGKLNDRHFFETDLFCSS